MRLLRWVGRNWAVVALGAAGVLCLLLFLGWGGGGAVYESSELLLGGWGVGPGEFGLFKDEGLCLGPPAFAPLPDGGVLVADAWNARVLRFDRRGRLVPGSSWPGPGGSPQVAATLGLSSAPPPRPRSPLLAMAVDGRRVYLAEGDRRRIQVFSLDGRCLSVLDLPADPAIPAEPGGWALEGLYAGGGRVFYCEQVTGPDGHRRRLWRRDEGGEWGLEAEMALSPEGRVTPGGRLAAVWSSLALDAEGRLCLEGPEDLRRVRRVAVFDARGLCREGELSVPGVADVVQLAGVDGRGCPFLQVESPPGYVRVLRYPPLPPPVEDAVAASSPQFTWISPSGVADLGLRARLGSRGALYLAEARPEGYVIRVFRRVKAWRLGWWGRRARPVSPPAAGGEAPAAGEEMVAKAGSQGPE